MISLTPCLQFFSVEWYYKAMAENHQNQPPTNPDNDRPRPTSSDHDRPSPTISPTRREEHTLTSREALKLFEQVGLPRSQRSIERYCQDEKLDCFFESDEQRYYVTQASVERLVGQLKEIQARHAQSAVAEPIPTRSDDVRQASPSDEHQEKVSEGKTKELQEKVSHLEKELMDEKILNKAKDYFIDQLKEDRQHFADERKDLITQLADNSRRIGELETKLLQLEAPKDKPAGVEESRQQPESRDTTFEDLGNDRPWQPQEPVRIPVTEDPIETNQSTNNL
jgi:hypothetical protein